MLRHLTTCLLLLVLSGMSWSLPAQAQTDTSTDTLSQVDVDTLRSRIEGLSGQDADTRKVRLQRLDNIAAALASTEQARTRTRELQQNRTDAPRIQAALRDDIEALRDLPSVDDTERAQLAMESAAIIAAEIASVETELNAATTRATNLSGEIQSRVGRGERLRTELATARSELVRVEEQLAGISTDPDADVDASLRRRALEANRDLRRAEIARLEAEATYTSIRGQTLQLRLDVATLEQARLAERLEQFQSLTGELRRNQLRELTRETLRPVASVPEHPLVSAVAAENTELITRYGTLAIQSRALPETRARTQRQLADVTSNLAIVTQLTELGDVQRAGETLRGLRANLPILSTIRADSERITEKLLNSTTEQLLAQQQISQLPIRRADPAAMLDEFRRANPLVPELSAAQSDAIVELMESRRDILEAIQEAAAEQADDAAQLKGLLDELTLEATELKTVLDSNLLAARSAQSIFSVDYPAKIVRGALKLTQPTRAQALLACTVLALTQFNFAFVIFLALVLLALALFAMRGSIRANIADAGSVVRKVREDTYFVTPRVALESTLLAAPAPLIVFAFGYVLATTGEANAFVLDVAEALRYLAVFLFAFLLLRAWAQKDGLFDRHIRITPDLRRGIQTETRWFVPLAATALVFMLATQNSRDTDIYEGVALTSFIVIAIGLGIFIYRLVLGRREAFAKTLNTEGALYRYRKPISVILVGIPFASAVAGALGYFSTSEEVLLRYIETLGAAILAFVIYGTLRRTINVTHRRLSLKQARERREAALRARREKQEAEAEEREAALKAARENPDSIQAETLDDAVNAEVDERPSPPAPPPVDYEQIDLEETSRQTRQLLATATIILFAVGFWLIWRDLLPALSIFDSIELYQRGERLEGEGETAITVIDYITLWDILQAVVTIAITFLAARNLPGFLEIFVLNRTSMEKGIRYAVVTILGYVIIGIGVFIALGQLGVDWGSLGFIVAALSLGIGFGLQAIIANFISGIIILFERPIRVGDYITVGDQSGTVTNIRIRATTLTDLDNKEILIPNQEFITSRVTNWTLTNSMIRVIIPVGIAYGSDTRAAQKIMLETLQAEPRVLDEPRAQVIFVNFGDSSLDFELRVFIRSFEDRFPVINAVHTNINLALERAGIGIPFPQRDLHLVSADGLQMAKPSS